MNHAKAVGVTAKLGLLSGTDVIAGHAFPIFMMATPDIAALQASQQEFVASAEAIMALADDEGRDLTDDEQTAFDAAVSEAGKVKAKIERLSALAGMSAGTGRKSAPELSNRGDQPGNGRKIFPEARKNDPKQSFESFGNFAMTVRNAGIGNSEAIARLNNVATTYGNETSGADGGFLVPPEFRREIWTKVMGEDNLITRTEQLITGSNNLTIPKDETTPWQTSGGIQVYWEQEAGTKTQSKPAFETTSMRLNKLISLVPVTDELLEDAPGLESWLRSKAPQKMTAKINTAIVDGTGAGQPLGILRAPSLVTVTKETSQAADTIKFDNINKMWSRMYAPSRRNAIWLINQDAEPQLHSMSFPGTGTAVPVYLPPGGLSASPYGTLMGRPVIPVEAAKTIGDVGDIILVDLSQYYTLTKGSGIKTDVSIHCYFEQDITAFRFVFRVAGQPSWGTAITPQNGTLTRSWAVALEAR